jgi:biotin carboxylase
MKRLLVLGAGYLQKFVIEKAVDLGYYVIAVDKNPNSVGFAAASESAIVDIVDPEACLEFAKGKNIDGVMTAATDYGVLSAAYVSEKLGLNGINQESAKIIKNKYMVRKTLSQKQIDCVKQFYEICCDEDIAALKGKITFPLMVKPCDGSGSKGAGRVDTFEEFEAAAKFALSNSLSKKAIAEDFVVGREYGAESLVINGEVTVLSVMQKDMTEPPYYAELGHTIPSGLNFDDKVKKTVKEAIEALGVNFGAVNMDMIITEDGQICIVDIGARMGGNLIGSHIIRLGTGIDYLENLIRATVGDSANLSPTKQPKCVSTRLLALTEGEIARLPDFDKIAEVCDVEIYHHLNVGDKINPYRNNLDGCGYVVATADSTKEAKEKAAKALSAIDLGIVRK